MAVTSNLIAYEVPNSVNISGNTSQLYVKLTATTSGASHNNYDITSTITINGVTYHPVHRLPSNTTTTIYETTLTITHNSDGKKTVDISYSIPTGISAGTLSNSQSVTLSNIPRYVTITSFSVTKRNETSVYYHYTEDASTDWAWYSTDNGSTWANLPTSGIVSVLSNDTSKPLSPNTTYNFKLRLRRTDSQLTTVSNTYQQTTYDYPHCTNTPNFFIGDQVSISLYNPLNRLVDIEFIGANGETLSIDPIATNVITGYNSETFKTKLYNSIPNTMYGEYQIKVIYGDIIRTRKSGNAYTIKYNECIPTFNNFTYKDGNRDVTKITDNDQVLVKGLSNLQVEINSTNKMISKNSAKPNKYTATIDTLNKSENYSENDLTFDVGTVLTSGTQRLTVTAYDSRSIYRSVYKDIIVLDYNKPVINVDVSRLNNFEAQTTLKVSGTYTKLTIDNTNKNSIEKVQYRYRETNDTWSDWENISTTVINGNFTCTDVILSLDNTKSFEIEVYAKDKLDDNVASGTIDVGEAIFIISSNKKTCYINNEEVATITEIITGEEFKTSECIDGKRVHGKRMIIGTGAGAGERKRYDLTQFGINNDTMRYVRHQCINEHANCPFPIIIGDEYDTKAWFNGKLTAFEIRNGTSTSNANSNIILTLYYTYK